jgi:hypothetical protein
LLNVNNQVIEIGPIVDGFDFSLLPPVTKFVVDLTITASLYQNRNINDPVNTPGTLVSAFGSSGSLVLSYFQNGIYTALIPEFTIPPGNYVLVLDAPVSPSGYQLHRERIAYVQTGQ